MFRSHGSQWPRRLSADSVCGPNPSHPSVHMASADKDRVSPCFPGCARRGCLSRVRDRSLQETAGNTKTSHTVPFRPDQAPQTGTRKFSLRGRWGVTGTTAPPMAPGCGRAQEELTSERRGSGKRWHVLTVTCHSATSTSKALRFPLVPAITSRFFAMVSMPRLASPACHILSPLSHRDTPVPVDVLSLKTLCTTLSDLRYFARYIIPSVWKSPPEQLVERELL